MPESYLKSYDWQRIERMTKVLKPCSTATLKLQNPNITLSDAHSILEECNMDLDEMKLGKCNIILWSMMSDKSIFKNRKF